MVQAPNFLLAAPILMLSAGGCWMYASSDWRRIMLLGLLPQNTQTKAVLRSTAGQLTTQHAIQHHTPQATEWPESAKRNILRGPVLHMSTAGMFRSEVAPYVFHWGFLTLFAVLFMHVQVSTRLLSACPPLYWWAATLCSSGWSRPVWGYFMLYNVLGCILFTNFYPWT